MSLFVDSGYAETVHRLAVGFEPWDPVRGGVLAHPVRIDPEGVLPWSPRHPDEPYGPGASRRKWRRKSAEREGVYPRELLPRIDRHDSCRQVLLVQPGVSAGEDEELDLRIYDHYRRHVPRRFHVTLDELPKVRRPALFPGAAYDVGSGATGLRGRVLRAGKTMRWARLEARVSVLGPPPNPDFRPVVGRAHGDDRGEFLLILSPETFPPATAFESAEVSIEITIWGPAVPPADPAAAALDPYWDLPLELLDEPGVATGETRPAAYIHLATQVVPLRLGRLLSAADGVADFEV